MRILHIDTETGFRGGEHQVKLLVEGLRLRGHASLIAGPDGAELLDVLERENFKVRRYGWPGLLGPRGPLLAGRVREAARRFRAEIVHAHTGNAHTLARSALGNELPIVVTRRVDFPLKANIWSRGKYRAENQHFIAISREVRRVLEAGGVPPEHISLVHSGVEVKRVRGGNGGALRKDWLNAGEDGPVIGFLGALVDHKAPWILAEAAPLIRRELPGGRVVFVGEGEERPRLEALRQACPEAIHLAGWRTDVANCYAAFDLFVMPSKLEGLCTALIDALAAGVPCVASRAGGIPDVVIDGETGVLVPPEDPQALADAIVAVWKDEDRRAQFVENGRALVDRCFTARAMVDGTVKVYERFARAPGSGTRYPESAT